VAALTREPVALFVFNRPDLTERVFARIRSARPPVLFVIADGPRPHVPGDAELCSATRSLVEAVDWPCDVQRDYSDANLGLWTCVGRGLDRVFEQVERAIVLEDDCLPDPTFFPFCDELLERYQHDQRVMMITGTTIGERWRPGVGSYHFSRRGAIWGWAGWSRAWRGHDRHGRTWNDPRSRRRARRALGHRHYRAWARWMDDAYLHQHQWGVQWTFSILERDGVSIVPSTNLVTNLGFRGDATHTVAARPRLANVPAEPMQFPLRHPAAVTPDAAYDRRCLELRHPAALTRWQWPWWCDEVRRQLAISRRARAYGP
jgi:hypothetical protein